MPTPTMNDPVTTAPNGDGVSQVKSRATEMAQKAADVIEGKMDTVARRMESAATAIRDRADTLPGGEQVASAAHTAADAMETAASYVRDHDLQDMLSEVQQVVKKHPGATLLAAVAAGFLIARSLSRH